MNRAEKRLCDWADCVQGVEYRPKCFEDMIRVLPDADFDSDIFGKWRFQRRLLRCDRDELAAEVASIVCLAVALKTYDGTDARYPDFVIGLLVSCDADDDMIFSIPLRKMTADAFSSCSRPCLLVIYFAVYLGIVL